MKALIINGSHRKGNTDILVDFVKDKMQQNSFIVDLLSLRDIDIKLPDGCEVCASFGICPNTKDEFALEIEPKIRDYDLYILATPVYDDFATPLTKIFWDRIVSWCHDDRKYLANKRLAVITHGMSDEKSWKHVVDWVKSVSIWEKATFAGSLSLLSGAEVGSLFLDGNRIAGFIENLTQQYVFRR